MQVSQRAAGFTLLELAVVVLVITLLLGSLLIPLATQVDQRNVTETQKRLQEVKEALIGYAITNGRFPCPAVASTPSAPTDRGAESVAGGVCTNFYDGYVPGQTLGLSNVDDQGYVVDAWGLRQNRIRYAVADVTINGIPHVFTTKGSMQQVGAQALGTPASAGGTSLIYVCGTASGDPASCAAAPMLTSDAVFIVYSLGKNAATSGGTSPDEAANLAGKPVFVSKMNSTTAGTEFDDLVLWSSRYTVVSQMINAGQLY